MKNIFLGLALYALICCSNLKSDDDLYLAIAINPTMDRYRLGDTVTVSCTIKNTGRKTVRIATSDITEELNEMCKIYVEPKFDSVFLARNNVILVDGRTFDAFPDEYLLNRQPTLVNIHS